MPANGSRFNAREIVFECSTKPDASDSGLAGTEIRTSKKLAISKTEKRMPATAAARGAFML